MEPVANANRPVTGRGVDSTPGSHEPIAWPVIGFGKVRNSARNVPMASLRYWKALDALNATRS